MSPLTTTSHMQWQEVLQLPEHIIDRLMHHAGQQFATARRTRNTQNSSVEVRYHRHVLPEQLPIFLEALPMALHPYALRVHAPSVVRPGHLCLPRLHTCHAAAAVTAACGLPHLTSLSLHVWNDESRHRGSDPADTATDLPTALSCLARSTTLRSLSLGHGRRHDLPHHGSACPPGLSAFSDAALAALPQFQHVTELTLIGFCRGGCAACAAPPSLPARLHSLKFSLMDPATDGPGVPLTGSDAAPVFSHMPARFAALQMLPALGELDISGSVLSGECWRGIVPELARLPMHSLSIAECGLVLTEALPLMCCDTGNQAAALKPFARLRSLDISSNSLDTEPICYPSMVYGREAPFAPTTGLLGQLTAVRALRLACWDCDVMVSFLQQLADSGALMHRFAIGRCKFSCAAQTLVQAGNVEQSVQACVRRWPGLRVLALAWQLHECITLEEALLNLPCLEDLTVEERSWRGFRQGSHPMQVTSPVTKLVLENLALPWFDPAAGAITTCFDGMTMLRVLILHGETGMFTHEHEYLATMMARLSALTELAELRLRMPRVCDEDVRGLAEALPQLRQLTCLEYGLPQEAQSCTCPRRPAPEVLTMAEPLVVALRAVPLLAVLRLHSVRLDGVTHEPVMPRAGPQVAAVGAVEVIQEALHRPQSAGDTQPLPSASGGAMAALRESLARLPRLMHVTLDQCISQAGLMGLDMLGEGLPWGATVQATAALESLLRGSTCPGEIARSYSFDGVCKYHQSQVHLLPEVQFSSLDVGGLLSEGQEMWRWDSESDGLLADTQSE